MSQEDRDDDGRPILPGGAIRALGLIIAVVSGFMLYAGGGRSWATDVVVESLFLVFGLYALRGTRLAGVLMLILSALFIFSYAFFGAVASVIACSISLSKWKYLRPWW